MASENHTQASVRHLGDARVLLTADRPDGAVHLAGFAAECALKSCLAQAIPGFDTRAPSHSIPRLVDRETAWAAAASGHRDLQRALDGAADPLLCDAHPDRRYWATSWSRADAAHVVAKASDIVEDRVIRPWLDRGLDLDLG